MKSKKIAMLLAVLLALMMILSVLIGALTARAVTSADLQKLKDKASSLASQRKQIERELKQIAADKSSTMKEKAKLDEQIDLTEQEIDNTQQLIEELAAQIDQKKAELDQAVAEEEKEYALFKRRIRATEEAGEASYFGVLLQADDFSDFLGRMDLVAELLAYDKTVMSNLARARQLVADKKASLEADQKDLEDEKKNLEDRRADLVAQCDKAENLIKQLESRQSDYEKAYDEAEKAQEEVQKQITAMIAELARSSVYVGGEYTWPLPGHYTITDGFGMRMHPVLKVYKLHTGVDIAAPKGAKIVAANAGTVIQAGYNAGYGNYVVVNHGGNQATLYGHMSKISVSVNQVVKQGQQLGLVGATGYATGNHLHFEIIVGGKQVDPMKYFKKQS